MVMKKIVSSENAVVIVSDAEDKGAFPVNYRYIMGDMMYTVIKAFRSDNTEMRTLVTAAGDVEELTVASMRKDAADPSFKKLDPKK